MKRLLLLATALVLAPPTVQAQATSKSAPSRLRRVFADKASSHKDRLAVLRENEGIDNESIAKALSQAHSSVHQEISALELRRLELNRELDENLMARKKQAIKGGARGARKNRKQLRTESYAGRQRLDGLRIERRAIEDRCEALRSAQAHRWVMKNVVTKSKRGIGLRLACVNAIGQTDHATEALGRALARAKTPDLLCVLLNGLVTAGPRADSTFASVLKRLSDQSPTVRELAARALAAQVRPEAVEPLIDRLEQTSGQTQKRTATLLETLTGQKHGIGVASWRAWFAHNKDAPLSARKNTKPSPKPPRTGRNKQQKEKPATEKPTTGTYMGIPQDGDSIVYLLDASNSMRVEVDFDLPGTSTKDGATRLDACKAELQRALKALRPPTKFSIVYFHESAGRFSESPMIASPQNITTACSFVREIKPLFATNTYDGFLESFALMSTPSPRLPPELGSGIDTIFLMTDGRPVIFNPTKKGQGGARDTFDTILLAIEDWDPLRRVTVHCIGIGKGLAKNKMRKLAESRGGEARFF